MEKMIRAFLTRFEQDEQGAIGELSFDDFHCFTLEPDANDPKKLYIPNGVYQCKRFHGTKWKNTFEIIVPGHSAVLFHSGNTEAHTLGCVLLGSSIGKLKGERAVLNSGATFEKFLQITADLDEFELEMKEEYVDGRSLQAP